MTFNELRQTLTYLSLWYSSLTSHLTRWICTLFPTIVLVLQVFIWYVYVKSFSKTWILPNLLKYLNPRKSAGCVMFQTCYSWQIQCCAKCNQSTFINPSDPTFSRSLPTYWQWGPFCSGRHVRAVWCGQRVAAFLGHPPLTVMLAYQASTASCCWLSVTLCLRQKNLSGPSSRENFLKSSNLCIF